MAAKFGLITLRALGRATLARRQLLARMGASVTDVVAQLGGLQAEWPKIAFPALAPRVKAVTALMLTGALRARKLVRATL